MTREKSACLSRMPDEVRLLQQAETITDYPTQLLRAVEDELSEYHSQLQICNAFLSRQASTLIGMLGDGSVKLLCSLTQKQYKYGITPTLW